MNSEKHKKNVDVETDVQKQDSDFITETIKQRPINKKKLLRQTLITAAMAVVFSLVACLTFLLLEPVISNWLYPEEEPEPIEFPEETEEMLPEDMIVDDSQMQPEPTQPPALEDEQIAQVLTSAKISSSIPLSATTIPDTAPSFSYSLSSHPTSGVTPTTVTIDLRTSRATSRIPANSDR